MSSRQTDPGPRYCSSSRLGALPVGGSETLRAKTAFWDVRTFRIGWMAAGGVLLLGLYMGVEVERTFLMALVYGLVAWMCAIPAFWGVETGGRRWVSPAMVTAGAFALYYGLGNIPCSLWAYEQMHVRNPGSYDYYPLAALLAAVCLFLFLKGYQTGVSRTRRAARLVTWETSRLAKTCWLYMAALLVLTFAAAARMLPRIVATTSREFIPTGFVLLVLLGFAVRGRPRHGWLGEYPILVVLSVLIPTLYFTLSGRRYFSLAMIVLVGIASHGLGDVWKLRHYAACFLAGVVVYVFVSVGVRQEYREPSGVHQRRSIRSVMDGIEGIPLALTVTLGLSDEAEAAPLDILERDTAYRMAGLEMIAGMLAARAKGHGEYLMGRGAFVGLAKMVPRVVWPSKPRFTWQPGAQWNAEHLTIQYFNLVERDQLTTPLALLYADGGWVGALLGIWIAGLVCGAVFRRAIGPYLAYRNMVLAISYSFSMFIFFQRTAVDWVIHPLRNLVIIWCLVRLIDYSCRRHRQVPRSAPRGC